MGVTCNLTAYEISGSSNITANTTNVYVKLTATATGLSHNNNQCPGNITVDGTQHNFTNNIPANSTVTLYEATHTIIHNNDGTKSIQINYSFTTGISAGTITGSQELNLSTIPRASTVTCSSGNIGSNVTININRASSNFRHTLKCEFYGWHDIVEKTSQTNYQWTIPTSFYENMGSMQSTWATMYCLTYDGDTFIGETQCRFDIYVPNTSSPTINATIVDTNTVTKALTGNENKLIKYFSNAKITMNATAKNGATIASKKATCGSQSSTTDTTFNNVESPIFKFECVDNRGLSTTTTIDKSGTEWVEYIKLYIQSPKLTRPNTTSNTINIELKGNWFNGNFGATSNTVTLKWRSRVKNGSWGSYTTVTVTKSENTFSYSGTLGTDFDFEEEYEFEFVATDKLMSYTYARTAARGKPIIDIGKNDIVVNGDSKINGILTILEHFDIEAFSLGLAITNKLSSGKAIYFHPLKDTALNDLNKGLYLNENTIQFNGKALAYCGQSLYSNSSGTTGALSFYNGEYSYNYNEMEIFYKDINNGGPESSVKVTNPNGKTVALQVVSPAGDNIRINSKTVTIGSSSISLNYNSVAFAPGQAFYQNANEIAITKVVGYK